MMRDNVRDNVRDLIKYISNKPFTSKNKNDVSVYRSEYISFIKYIIENSIGINQSGQLLQKIKFTITEGGYGYALDVYPTIENFEACKELLKNKISLMRSFFLCFIYFKIIDDENFGDLNYVRSVEAKISEWDRRSLVFQYVNLISILISGVDDREMAGDLKKLLNGAYSKIKLIDEDYSKFKSDSESGINEIRVNYNNFYKSSVGDLQALKLALLEKDRIGAAEQVWRVKSRRHRIAGWISFSIVLIILVSFIYLSVFEWAVIKRELSDILKQAGGYAALPVVLAPVLAATWVVRLLSRLSMSEFMLADDAYQRTAMAQTYYILVSDQEAGMQKGDRLLVLNSLFRPLPGHQAEEVNPPNFAELMKEMMTGSNKS